MNRPVRMLVVAIAVAIVAATYALAIEYAVKTQDTLDAAAAYKTWKPFIEELQAANITASMYFTPRETIRMRFCD